ncbi:LppU/SCO3897 family protein [Tsukamurella sp. DT100]|uniref:LppU/SCO3897 family protein n=1 Tax=Tsukamurella sp. DT100 TaxID=3393415 RepID=UPI003CEF84EF
MFFVSVLVTSLFTYVINRFRRRGFVTESDVESPTPNYVRVLVNMLVVVAIALTVVAVMFGQSIHPDPVHESSGGVVHVSAAIPGQMPNSPQKIGDSPSTGDCLRMEGADDDTTVVNLECGHPDAAFKVIGVVSRPSGCPQDADQRYFQSRTRPAYALCLDYNWQTDRCISVDYTTGVVANVPCDRKSAKNARTFRPIEIYYDVEGGRAPECKYPQIPHQARKYSVCVAVS